MSADDLLPPDEPLDRRVTIGLAKIGIALKQQAWAKAGGRGRPGPGPGAGAATWAAWRVWRLRVLAEQLGVTAATTSDSVAALQRKALPRNRQRATAGGGRRAAPLAAARRPPPLLGPTFYWRRSASSRLPSRPHSCVRSSR